MTTGTGRLDYFGIDPLLTEEERLTRETVARLVDREVVPGIGRAWLAGEFPRELVPKMGALRLFGANLPQEYGCAGMSNIAYGLIMQELERGDSGVRSFASVQGALVMYPIHAFGSEEQRRTWLPAMAAGERIGCFGLTEPNAGSDPGAMQTRARRSGNGWVLDGTKMWITNGSIADVAVVWAETDGGVRGFLVDRGSRGFSATDVHRKLSLRASVTSELSFESVRVPADAVLPGVRGLRGPLSCLSEARYGVAWGAMGSARACYESALEYSRQRIAFGKPIAAYQLTQQKLVDMATAIVHGRLLVHRLGVLKDEGRAHPVMVSLAKRANVRTALDIARSARTVLGANGVTLEYPVARHMANLESVLTYEGTEEVHTLVIGKALTGEDAFA